MHFFIFPNVNSYLLIDGRRSDHYFVVFGMFLNSRVLANHTQIGHIGALLLLLKEILHNRIGARGLQRILAMDGHSVTGSFQITEESFTSTERETLEELLKVHFPGSSAIETGLTIGTVWRVITYTDLPKKTGRLLET